GAGHGGVGAADLARVGGWVGLRSGCPAEGAFSLRGVRVGRGLECEGARLSNATADGAGVSLAVDHATIDGQRDTGAIRGGIAEAGALAFQTSSHPHTTQAECPLRRTSTA